MVFFFSLLRSILTLVRHSRCRYSARGARLFADDEGHSEDEGDGPDAEGSEREECSSLCSDVRERSVYFTDGRTELRDVPPVAVAGSDLEEQTAGPSGAGRMKRLAEHEG
jgi:hypothetical protein